MLTGGYAKIFFIDTFPMNSYPNFLKPILLAIMDTLLDTDKTNLLLVEALEVGIVEVHEGVLECFVQLWTVLKQFFIQNCTCKMFKNWIFFKMGFLRCMMVS